MANNNLERKVTLDNYDKCGWFICPLCVYDALKYETEYCPQCGVKLNWSKNLSKIKNLLQK